MSALFCRWMPGRLLLVVLVGLLFGGLGWSAAATGAAAPATDRIVNNHYALKRYDRRGRLNYKLDELLVRFRAGVTEAQQRALHQSVGGQRLHRRKRIRLDAIKLPPGMPVDEAIRRYGASGLVEHVELHVLRYAETQPDDSLFDQQWSLRNTGQNGGTPDADIDAPEAWDFTTGAAEVVIAVIDTGVDYLHPDLAANMWVNQEELHGDTGVDDDHNGYKDDIYGYDFADHDSDPMDVAGHGTHVAGIAAAAGNNSIGIAGVSWQARIMALKAQADADGFFDDGAIIEAVYYAIDNGADIVNCSFGGYQDSTAERNAFAALQAADIPAVCAAGNDNNNTDSTHHFPSGYDLDNIIAVAAGDDNDQIWRQDDLTGSNYGAVTVDLMAPGVNIVSTIPATSITTASVTVNAVATTANGMTYAGTTGSDGITATLYDCGRAVKSSDCPVAVAGNLALIQRDGIETFALKTTVAQNRGAIGAIIYNHQVGVFGDNFDEVGGTLGGRPIDWIPVVSISKAEGESLRAAMGSSSSLANVTLKNILVETIDNYVHLTGTSMAAPHVSGIAALLLATNPKLGYERIKNAIMATVDPLPGLDGLMRSSGRANARSALSMAFPPGDLTGDNEIGLDDLVLALQIVTGGGLSPTVCATCPALGADVGKDDIIGLAEAIFDLQRIAGLR